MTLNKRKLESRLSEKNAYAQAGVDVEAGYEVVERIKKHVKRTERLGVMGALGGFGGMFDLTTTGVKEPVLVSGTDVLAQNSYLQLKLISMTRLGSTVWRCV